MSDKGGKAYRGRESSASQAFGTANPGYWSELSTDPAKAEKAAELHRRAEETIRELHENFEDTQKQRFMEQLPIEKTTRNVQAEEIAEGARKDFLMPPRVAHEANKAVAADHNKQIESIRIGADHAVRDLADNSSYRTEPEKEKLGQMSEQERASHFKAEIHKVLDDAQQARTQARRIFAHERSSLIDHARQQGSENPERDVSVAHAKTLQKIDKAEHQSVHKVFENYGWERGLRNVEFSEDETKIDNSKLRKLVEDEVWLRHSEDSQKQEAKPNEDRGEDSEHHDHDH